MANPSAVLATNIRRHRLARDLAPEQMAERMASLGHPWEVETVGLVEDGSRPLPTDELVGVALVLGVSWGDLLDPTLDGGHAATLDVGGPEPLWGALARLWVRGQIKAQLVWSDRDLLFTPGEDIPLATATPVNAQWRRRPRR